MLEGPTLPAQPRELDEREQRLMRGALAGRYVVLEKLGAGGMGVVYAAYDLKLDRKVAVKLLSGDPGRDRRRRLEREAQAMARLSHANVLPVHDVGLDGEDVFVAMELVEGMTLARWLAQPAHGWRQVLRVFVDAGRGLAAAHEAGLVHRDFKPDNVLVRGDGHVFVTDFGLARAAGTPGDAGHDSQESPLAAPLTRTGTVMGTPAYMAPEQHRGEPADARSDQFAFCVALYEGLWGVAPFRPERRGDMAALAAEVTAGRVQPPPRSAVPGWVQRAIFRGLRPAPADRFASMAELLAELTADPRERRRAWLLVGALTVAAGGALLAWQGLGDGAGVCRDPGGRLAGVWDDAARQQARLAFAASKKPYAARAIAGAERLLDAYAAAWAAAHTDACEAGRVRAEQSPLLFDLRMQCLDRRRAALGAFASLLAQADVGVVDRAVQLASGLPPISACSDTEALLAAVPEPEDPAVRDQVAALRRALEEPWALERAGKYERALRALPPLVAEARRIGYPPLIAESLHLLGSLNASGGDAAQAEAALAEALRIAAQAGDRARVATIELKQLWLLGVKLSRHDQALAMLPLVDAAVSQVHDDGLLRYVYLTHMAQVRGAAGDYDGALAANAEAMAVRAPQVGARHHEIGRVHNSIGNLLLSKGRYADAEGHFQRSLQITEETVGREHPIYAMLLNNLGNVAVYRNQWDEALVRYRQAVAVQEKLVAPDDATIMTMVGNVAMVLAQKGDFDEAERLRVRQIAAFRAALGPGNPRVAEALNNHAELMSMRGRDAEAEALAREALAIREAAQGKEHHDVSYPVGQLAGILLDRGRATEALEHARRFQALRDRHAAAGTPPRAAAAALVGEALVELGRSDEALPLLEEAVAILDKVPGAEVPPPRARFALARALWGRERPRALELVRSARAGFVADGASAARRVAEIDHWLATKPGR